MISPCISICVFDKATGYCAGCGRTVQEKKTWKLDETSEEWKAANIEDCKTRLTPEQLDCWKKSYEFKLAHGKSIYKFVKELRNET